MTVVINIETNIETNIEAKISGFSEQLLMSFNSNMGWLWFGNDSFWMKQM